LKNIESERSKPSSWQGFGEGVGEILQPYTSGFSQFRFDCNLRRRIVGPAQGQRDEDVPRSPFLRLRFACARFVPWPDGSGSRCWPARLCTVYPTWSPTIVSGCIANGVSGLMWELTYLSPSLLLRIITHSPGESAGGTQTISFNGESQPFSTAIEHNNGRYSLVLAPMEGLVPWTKYYLLAD
jgi:hypothetical protein